ncbi:hypothetical protein TrST_g9186 [Triparma strigata]|uniref:Ion transport domain-containing protein n=1 Tax=Triparma strigata TaxID=1606541 RepID=A0A9W7EHW1_9STRA|nr:hypothetical protein TrST_g9186 [Triparma strigata]
MDNFSTASVVDDNDDGIQLNTSPSSSSDRVRKGVASPGKGRLQQLSDYYNNNGDKKKKGVVNYSPDVVGIDKTKTEEDIATESQYCHDIPGLGDKVDKARVIKVSPDQTQLYISDGDEAKKQGSLHVLNVAEGKLVRTFDYYDIIGCLAFADPEDQKANKVYAGTGNGDIIAYEVNQKLLAKQTIWVTLKGGNKEDREYDEPLERFGNLTPGDKSSRGFKTAHHGRIYGIKVTHYGRFLISVSEDQTIKVWDIQPDEVPKVPVHLFKQEEKIYSIDSLSFDTPDVLNYVEKTGTSLWPLEGAKIKKKDKDKRQPSRPAYMVCTGNRFGSIHVYYLRGKRKVPLPSHIARSAGFMKMKRKKGTKRAESAQSDDTFLINNLASTDVKWNDLVLKSDSLDDEPSTKRELKAHSKSLYALLFSKDGSRLYSGAFDRLIKIWETSSLSCLQTLVGHTSVVCTLAVEGDFLCSGSYDKSIKLWHLETGTEVRTITGSMVDEKDGATKKEDGAESPITHKAVHHDRVNDVIFFNGGTNIISASTDKTVKRWNIAMNQEDARVLREWSFSDETERIQCMSVSKGTKRIITGGGITKTESGQIKKHGTVRLWSNLDNIETGTSKDTKEEKHINTVTLMLGSERETDEVGKRRHTEQVEDVVISADGKTALSVANDDKVILWDLTQEANGVEGSDCFVKDFNTGNRGHSIALSKDTMKFYTGVGNGILQEWLTDDNSKIEFHDKAIKKAQAHMGWIMAIRLTSDEKTMVTGGFPDEAKIWNTESRELVFSLGRGTDPEGNQIKNHHLGPVMDLEITPDDKKVATCSEDSTIKVWEVSTGVLLATLEGHEGKVTSISIRSGGDYLASGSEDKTWKLWTLDNAESENAKDSYKLVYTSSQGQGSMMPKTCVAFSSDDSRLLSGSTHPRDADIFSSEKLGMIFYHLPSVVQECMFKNDCMKEDEGTKLMDWKSSETTMTLRQEPNVLCEPQIRAQKMVKDEGGIVKKEDHEHHMKNLLHLAASDGRSNFIKSSIFYESKNDSEKEKQKIALKALLMKDSNGRLPIDSALEFENGATVDVILQGFAKLLSKDFATPFHEDQNSQEQHPSELFPLKSLCRALEEFPSESLEFVCSLELVSGGDFLVQKGVKRCELPKSKRLLWGSEERIPHYFWVDRVGYTTEFYEKVLRERKQSKGFWAQVNRFAQTLLTAEFWTSLFKRNLSLDDESDSDEDEKVEAGQGGRRPSKVRKSLMRTGSYHVTSGDFDGEKTSVKELVKGEEAMNRKSELGNPVTAKFVPIKGIAGKDSNFLECLIKAASESNKFKAFENEVVRSVIEYKWDKFAKEMFIWHMIRYLAMVLCMTVDAFMNKTLTNGSNWRCVFDSGVDLCNSTTIDGHLAPQTNPLGMPQIFGRIPMLITLVLWFYFTWHEYKQSKGSNSDSNSNLGKQAIDLFVNVNAKGEYLSDFWNKLDSLSLFLIFLSYFFRFLYWGGIMDNTATTVTLSFALPITWVNLLFFLQGFDESGKLVRMITGIMRANGTKYFTIILIVCMVGFAAGFFVLYENQNFNDLMDDPEDKSNLKQMNPFMSVFSAYTLMLGEFDVTEFPGTSFWEFISTILLFIVFTAFINIIMLNLLIAIMSDIFDRVQESAQSEFLFARARIILEFEEMLKLNNKKREKKSSALFPTWLQVLTPADHQKNAQSDLPSNEWSGRVQKVTNSIKELSNKMDENVENARETATKANEELKEQQEAIRKEQEALRKQQETSRQEQEALRLKQAEQQEALRKEQEAFRKEQTEFREEMSNFMKAISADMAKKTQQPEGRLNRTSSRPSGGNFGSST